MASNLAVVRRPLHPATLFALRFLTVFALLLGVMVRFHWLLAWVSNVWATILGSVLNLTGLGPARVMENVVVYADGVTLIVILECTGLHLAAMWLGVVVAFPATFAHRLRGLGVGFAVIAVANVLRLWMAALVLDAWPQYFELVHTFIWQAGMVLILLVLAAWWMRRPDDVAAEGG